MSVNEKMTAIAENIRSKTGGTEALTLDDMASGVNEVFEAGKKAEYNEFWDIFQDYGNRTFYNTAFARGFPKASYNPKYNLKGSVNSTFAIGEITDVKVRILDATDIQQIVRYNSSITRIPELNISESTNFGTSSPFIGATKLSDITLTGVLATSVSFSDCPLSVASMKSIISCLKDYSAEAPFTHTLTLKDSCKTALEGDTETVSFNGEDYTYFELITAKGWNLA